MACQACHPGASRVSLVGQYLRIHKDESRSAMTSDENRRFWIARLQARHDGETQQTSC